MANVQRALDRHQPATLVVNFEESVKEKATNFKLLQQEQFIEGIKALKVKNEP